MVLLAKQDLRFLLFEMILKARNKAIKPMFCFQFHAQVKHDLDLQDRMWTLPFFLSSIIADVFAPLQKLQEADDDSYMDAGWASTDSLKKSLHGIGGGLKFRPGGPAS